MENWQNLAPQLVVANRRTSARCRRRVRSGELVPVFRNVYISTDFLSTPDRWERATRATIARACAVATVLGPRAVISHETAAVMHGIPMVDEFVDVHVSIGRRWGGGAPTLLPAIVLPSQEVIPSVRLVRHESLVPGPSIVRRGRISLSDPVETAVQCACSLHPRKGVVAVSGILRFLSRFDRFQMTQSRHREEHWRARIGKALNRRGASVRHVVRGRAVLAAADAGCESVAEAVLVWTLKAAGFTGVHTQVLHVIGDSRYFVDVEIEGSDAALEFDGKIKYGVDRDTILENLTRQNRRQKDLESVGLTVLHFEYRELNNWRAIRDEVVRRSRISTPPKPNRVLLAE